MDHREAAAAMADELEGSRLVVELFPAPRPMFDGHMVRIATEGNPWWYSSMAKHIAPRHKRRTRCTPGIRRGLVLATLRTIAAGRYRGTLWQQFVLHYVERWMTAEAAREVAHAG